MPTLDSIGISSNISKSILKLTTGGYDFVRQVLRPVRLCLDNHFDGSKTDFLAHWGKIDQNFSFTNFVSRCKGNPGESH